MGRGERDAPLGCGLNTRFGQSRGILCTTGGAIRDPLGIGHQPQTYMPTVSSTVMGVS